MINTVVVEKKLREKYSDIECVTSGIYKAIDKYAGREYAIHFFDLTDEIMSKVDKLGQFQEEILSETYFSGKAFTDLRWNHYLHFVISAAVSKSENFNHVKTKIESDKEYARKSVILENEIDSFLTEPPVSYQKVPEDITSIWINRLEKYGLTYVLDEDITVPKAAREIASGRKDKAQSIITPSMLTPSEKVAAKCFLRNLSIKGFRPYPKRKTYKFGKVNLIVGNNGAGKTSLLEAIEYLFCGRNRRPSNLMDGTSVSAQFVDSDVTLETSVRTLSRQLFTRHSHWYAKTDIKKITLHESFGKFNFLDSDAAVHLTVDDSEDRIRHDIICLLLGPGAEKLKDRLQRVCEKIDEFAKDRTHNLDSDSQLLSAAQLHLKSLQKAPQLSDTLFQEFCSWLIKIGWQNIPATKREISAIRECLQLAYNSIEILIRSNIHIPVIDEKTLLERRNIVTASIKSLTILNEQIKVASVSIAKSNRKQATLRTQLVSLDALFPYAKAEYTRKTEKRLELRKHIDVTIERLSSFEDEDIDIGLGDVLSSPIGTSAIAAVNLLAKQEKKLTEARRAFKAMKNSQSSINVLRQNLLITAQELLRKVPNPDQCPICHTDFAAGELKNRMLSAIIDDSERKLRDLQLKVTSAEQELAQKRQRSTILNRLLAFVGKKDDITVDKAIEMVIQERQTLKLELKNLKDLDKYFQVLADTGLDERKLSEHLKILGLNQLLNVSEISKIKAEMIDQVDKEVKGEKSSKNLIEKIRADVEKCASDFGIPIDATPEEVIKQLHSQLSVLDMIIKAISELSTLVDMKGKKFNELAIQIEQAQSQFQKLATAIARERVDISNVEVEKEKIENLENRIKKVGKERNRLLEAKKLFNELTEQLTGDDLVSQILTENASLISLIFTVIHMPNEFKIKVEQGKFFILRRETGEKVKLTEMSSGQRAAYALSLFLAMNARLVGGPRVLLFDDPIAHVDDMNVLSFIDHLRNVAVKGSRQIFFATADNKVAGLFRQKFRFLGDKDFCDIELSRDEYH